MWPRCWQEEFRIEQESGRHSRGFNAFGDYAQIEFVTGRHDPVHDGAAHAVLVDVARQCHVQFDVVRLEFRKQVESGISRTEIVNGGPEADPFVFPENIGQVGVVADALALGNFEHQAIG
jgi:hypothetical protein